MSKFIIIKTTYPNLASAKKIIKILLQEKLIACAQFCQINSSYLWENKIVNDKEIVLNLKTQKKLYQKVKEKILQNHQYQVPQIIAIEVSDADKNYGNWIKEVTK